MSRKSGRGLSEDVPGNAVMSQRAHDDLLYRTGRAWFEFIQACERLGRDDVDIMRVTIKGHVGGDEPLLVVLVADGPEGPVVAFHNADEVYGLWSGLSNRIKNGNVKWRPDEYAK